MAVNKADIVPRVMETTEYGHGRHRYWICETLALRGHNFIIFVWVGGHL